MNDGTNRLEQSEAEMLAFEVSDEALEVAAGTGYQKALNYTNLFCTFYNMCPGP